MRVHAGVYLKRGSLENARRSLEEIERAIADRAALVDAGERGIIQLSYHETVELLETCTVGRLAYVARGGVPDIVPVNYVWYDGGVLIRSGPGPKLQAAQRHEMVAFEVDQLDEENRTGRSAVVVGSASVVEPLEIDVESWAAGPRRHLILITPTRVEGRRLA